MERQNLEKYLPGKPIKVSEIIWFYLLHSGINIVFEDRDRNKYYGTFQFIIPWKKLEESLVEYKKAKKKQEIVVKKLTNQLK